MHSTGWSRTLKEKELAWIYCVVFRYTLALLWLGIRVQVRFMVPRYPRYR